MKRVILLCLLAISLFSSCVDVEERYTFNENGSCKVVFGLDMSKAISVLKNLLADSIATNPEFEMIKDTTLNFYAAMPDSIRKNLNEIDTKLAQKSALSVKMDLKKNLMSTNITYLANDAEELEYYLKNISKISVNSKLAAIAKSDKANLPNDKTLIAGPDYYTYEITPSRFKRVVDKIKFNDFLKRTHSTLVMAKAMLIDMPYKVVLNFAKPIKRINNSKAIVSADKKSIVLEADMDEIIKNPAIMDLQIDF